MSYLVLARKWRPKQFTEVVAQQHVTRTIENAIQQNRLASAYLFAGPRGVGKTTMARLLAKAVNCENGPTPAPCDRCVNCAEIAGGRSLDVIEIDGASNRGIDEVRNLRENARFVPAKSVKKIYIIDEVHMLTEAAFNALLKIIEEPPPHVLFVFATTEIHKVPATILSRCQRFDFRRVPLPEIVGQLAMICQNEGIQVEEAALYLIAKRAEGSMRDSQSLLDQVISFCGSHVDKAGVSKLFGMIEQELFFECTEAAAQGDYRAALALGEKIQDAGVHLGEFFERLADHLSNVLTVKLANDFSLLVGLESYAELYRKTAAAMSEAELLRHLQIVTEAQAKLARISNPRILLEMTLLKMVAVHAPQPREASASSNGNPQSAPPKPATSAPIAPPAAALAALKVDGIVLIPQVSHKVAPVESATPAAPKMDPANGGPASPGLFARLQTVPVVKTKEAAVPLATNIVDVETALQAIQSKWPAIVEHIKAQRISLGSFLEEGFPSGIVEGALEICFGNGDGFHINTVNHQKTFIQQIIQHETGYSLRLVCRKGEVARPPAARAARFDAAAAGVANGTEEPAANGMKPSVQTVEDLFQNYPLVKKFVEAVDGELIRRHV
ncbi:MAG: DNA polymerase III subunit gamma/tau [bacterium]